MNGAIIVNKEKDMTSRDVVNKLNKILKTKSIGHIGTLDPLATGVLVCLVGKATKLSNTLVHESKEYIASFKLGILTDTLDITGKVLDTKIINVTEEDLKDTLKSFVGTYEQEVPLYSAVKINGKRLYDYARSNEKVNLPKRNVTISRIELLSFDDDIVKIKTTVSKGTYIRSLINDIASRLNTYGVMTDLVRTKLGDFKIEDASYLEEVANNNYHLYSIEELLNPEVINIKDEELIHFKNGNIVKYKTDSYVLYKYHNENIALYQKLNDKEIKPLIMF